MQNESPASGSSRVEFSRVVIPRFMQFALFVTGMLWLLAARLAAIHAAAGIGTRFDLAVVEPLLGECFFLFLLLTGFTLLNWVATREGGIRSTNTLPARTTAAREWKLGAALGWAMLLVAVLPMAVSGKMHPQFWFAPQAWLLAMLSLLTLGAATLALEVAFRGFVFRKLIAATGPMTATILLSLVYATAAGFRPNATGLSFAVTFLTGVLFSMAYLRTHGLWLGWGLHFAWDAAMGVMAGLPVGGIATYTSLVSTNTFGPAWLTGEAYGPEGALLTIVVLLAAMVVLYRLTRDYAWEYTHVPIVAAGYAMDVAPPKEHAAMEADAAAKPMPLVQILGTTSTTASTMPIIAAHFQEKSAAEGDK